MIKNKINYGLRIFLTVITLLGWLLNPVKVDAKSETLGDLKQSLKSLQAKKAAQDSAKKKTQSEINANINKKLNAENELEQTKAKIISLTEEIESTNNEIIKLKKVTEDILILYQQLESENIYISFITGASSMTDLIMRLDVINQLTDDNEKKLNELETLIENNKKLNKELVVYQASLDDKIIAFENSIEALGDELAEMELGALSIQQEIDALQETIKSYEKIGCKDDQELTVCVNVANNTGWLKPVAKGRITSLYGYRVRPTSSASSFHRGVDIGMSDGTKVYATAAGTVGAIVRKASCGGNMVYVWAYVNGKPYTYVFMHLLEIKVNVGDAVNVNTVLGLSGGGITATSRGGYDKCTTGAHLHYGLASGGFYGTKTLALSKFNSNTMKPPGYPGLYQWFYSR